MIDAVSFDGDETLWDFQGAMRTALAVAASRFAAAGLTRDGGATVSAGWLMWLRDQVAARPGFRHARMETIRLTSLREAAAMVGADEGFADRVFAEFMDLRHQGVRLYPDAEPCLRALAGRGLRLALVTNGNSDPARLGLSGLLEVIVVAADCGLRKPDPAIYRYAADRLKVTPAACVHVGDHLVEDVRASAVAGMRPVWINRGALARSADAPVWREIMSLDELPALVDLAARGGR